LEDDDYHLRSSCPPPIAYFIHWIFNRKGLTIQNFFKMFDQIQMKRHLLHKGGVMWLRHFTNGHLLDDRSAPATHHKSDSSRPLPSFRNFRYWGRVYGLHEGDIVFVSRINRFCDNIFEI